MKGVNGFTFFKNYYDAITDPDNGLTAEEQGELYNAIFAYMFEDILPSLKGACRMAFNLIKPSLDKSKARSAARIKEEETEPREEETGTNRNQTQSNGNQKKSNEIKPQSNEKKTDFSSSMNKEKEQERENKNKNKKNEQEEKRDIGEREEEKRSVRSEAQKEFFERYPLQVDNYSAGDYAEIDFELLRRRFDESEFLQKTKSFSWVCQNYRKIAGGGYRDFDRGKKREVIDENGDTPEQAKRRAEFRAEYGDRGR